MLIMLFDSGEEDDIDDSPSHTTIPMKLKSELILK